MLYPFDVDQAIQWMGRKLVVFWVCYVIIVHCTMYIVYLHCTLYICCSFTLYICIVHCNFTFYILHFTFYILYCTFALYLMFGVSYLVICFQCLHLLRQILASNIFLSAADATLNIIFQQIILKILNPLRILMSSILQYQVPHSNNIPFCFENNTRYAV